MQPNSAPDRTFLQRTDSLAARLGCNVQDLPDIIGVSRRTIFEGRSAESAVSAKTLAKLEEAERRAAAEPPQDFKPEENAKRVSYLNEGSLSETGKFESSVVRDDETPYRFTPKASQCQGHGLEEEGLKPVLERIAKALEKLVQLKEREKP